MPSHTTYQIANITFRVASERPLFGPLADHLDQFAIATTQADVQFAIRRIHSTKTHPFDDPALAQQLAHASDNSSCATSPLLHHRKIRERLRQCLADRATCRFELHRHTLAINDFARHRMTIFFNQHSPLNSPTPRQLDFSLFALHLTMFDAGMCHSSCVVRDGTAALFIASDGGGKTTIATSSPYNTILCDDQNIIQRTGSEFFAHGTPWGRHFDAHTMAPLGALFFLEKAPQFGLTPLAPHDATKRIWPEFHACNLPLPDLPRARTLALIRDLIHQVPAYTLRFAKHHVDWHAITDILQAQRRHRNVSGKEAHAISNHVETTIRNELPQVQRVTIHTEPPESERL